MYFITPCDPNIFLIGMRETQLYGIGEKNSMLCIYEKSLFDVGKWKEFYVTGINVVKCECCKNGIHVAASLDRFGGKYIWIAVRKDRSTCIFSIDIDTKKFIQYKMLNSTSPEFVNLNLCCKCLSPAILNHAHISDSLTIAPQKYQSKTGIYRICVSIIQSDHCLLWKNHDTFFLNPRSSSNILINNEGEVLSVIEKAKNGRIKTFSMKFNDIRQDSIVSDALADEDVRNVWHEISFNISEGYCLSQRKEDNNLFLRLYYVDYSVADSFINFDAIDEYTLDATFPPIESTNFFVTYRYVDKEYVSNKASLIFFAKSKLYAVITFVVFQASNGKMVVIPRRMLSLSESAYLTLTKIPQASRLPIAKVSIYDYIFQQIRILCCTNDLKEKEAKVKQEDGDDIWMSLDFVKRTLGLSNDFDLIHL